jgi:outer membrane protein TolC
MMNWIGILLVLAGTSVAALAQTNAPEVRKLSPADCIEIALRHNFDVQIKRYNPDIAGYTLSAGYGTYDPSFNVSGGHDYALSAGGLDAQGRSFSGTESDDNKLGLGFSGLLPWGLNYNVGSSFQDTYGTQPGNAIDLSQPFFVTNTFLDLNNNLPHSFVSTNFGSAASRTPFENFSSTVGFLQLRQPLLKNFWIDNTRLQILLNKKNIKLSEEDLRNQLMTTITAVEQGYYEVIFAQENVKVQQSAMELAERLLAENKKRVEVGSLAPLDERQSQSQVASSRADLLAALGTRDTQQRVLKNLLSDDYGKWKDVFIEPTEALVAVPQTFELQESWRKGLSLRPDLLQQKLSLEKQGYVVRFQKNQMLPELDLVGTAGYSASSPGMAGALDQLRGRDNPFWSGGAQLTIPLGNISARNNYKGAKATKDQIVLQLKQLEQTDMIQIENAIAVAKTSFQRVDATREARLYAEAALDAEQKKLESGKSTSFVVLQLQKDLTAARSAEIRALADYNEALAQLSFQEGSTLDRRRVMLQAK